MNGFSEKELSKRFHTDDYKVSLVAKKFQTVFDEPLLHIMNVDKPLSEIKTVQTLFRLNRTSPGKDDTFILDFVNEPEEIKAAFQLCETTGLSEVTVPNILYELQDEFEPYELYMEEVEVVNLQRNPKAQTELNALINKAVDRYKQLSKEE